MNIKCRILVFAIVGMMSVLATASAHSAAGPLKADGVGAVKNYAETFFPTDVNVRDFGAKGDGVSDDTAAIQAAAEAAFNRADKMRVSICWRNYSRATRKDTPMPRLVFPQGTYRITGPVFFRGRAQLYGLGNPVIRASSSDMDMFVFHYSVRHYVQGLTMEGGRHQFLVETYNIDSANFTARDCTFRRSSAAAVDSHNWRLASVKRKEVKKKNGRVGTYMPNPSGSGFVRDPRRNSSSVVPYNNSTLITVERCRFEDCAMVADITPDGAVLRDLSVETSVSTECLFRFAGNIHVYGLWVSVKRPAGAKDFAIVDFQRGHSLIENSRFESADGAGVCLVRSSSVPKPLSTPSSIILRNLDVACGGCPEGAIISCRNRTTPEIITVADVRDATGKAVKAVAFEGGITTADYDALRLLKTVGSEYSYAISLGRNSSNVDCSLPEAAERFRENVIGVPNAIPSLKVPMFTTGRVLWGGDYGLSVESSGDDTEGMQRLFDEAARYPGCVAVLPPRCFTLKESITLSGRFTVRAAGAAIVTTKDDNLTLFNIAEGSDVTFEHVFFVGGANHVVCAADRETRVTLDCCHSYDAARSAYVMRSPKAKDVIKFTMNGGVSIAPMLYDGNADAVISDTWLYVTAPEPPGVMFRSAVGLVNEGKMLYQDVLGCPGLFESVKREGLYDDLMKYMSEHTVDFRWVDNKGGEFHSIHSRFGGEFGGFTLAYNSEGGKVQIEGSLACIQFPFMRRTPVYSDKSDADVRMFGVTFKITEAMHNGDVLLQYRSADGTVKAMPKQTMCCVLPRPALELADSCGFDRQIALEKFSGCEISASCSLDELVSGRGEDERYRPCETSAGDVKLHSECVRRAGQDAWDARASVSNLSPRPRFLRLVFRAKVPESEYKFWNGYLNQSAIAEKLQEQRDYLRMALFPAIAAIGKDRSLVLGMDPMMLAARVDTSLVKQDDKKFLQFAFPVYLPPGEGFSASMTVASAPARYLWHDVVETWYRLFPAAFAPADKIHPGLYYPEACYLFWSASKYGIPKTSINARREALCKVYGDNPCWEWCYKPFVRGGDWSITDKWSVGWNGYTAETVEAKRADSRKRMAEGELLNVAPMWYLNVCWTERDMGLKEFPGIEINSQKTKYRPCWNQDTMRPVYCGGNTPYEKLFRESLAHIPKEYPEAKGIGWDSCFATERLPETHLGFKGTPCKSFIKGEPFVHEAVGVSGLLDFNHEHFSGQYRMANAVNQKLAAPWMISVRSDAVLFEGTPVMRPVTLWLHESFRARLGPRKSLTWHKGCEMKRLEWAEFDKMPPELRDDAHRQILDDLLFLCYYRGTVPAAMITSENRERLVSGVTELMNLIASGWHASPACDVPAGILVARYGDGAATRLAVINPGYEKRDAQLFLPGEYWPAYKDGKRIDVSIPARHIVIVDPATGEYRPAEILPPAPVKKVLEKGLMNWMDQNGLLGFSNRD